MISTMTTMVEAGGKITIPEELLEEAGLPQGMPLEITVRAGQIVLEPQWRKIRIERRGLVSVAVPIEPVEEPLTDEQVQEAIEAIRQERIDRCR